MKRKAKTLNKPVRSSEVPATAGMLYEMEDRLNHKLDAGLFGLKSDTNSVKSDMHSVKSDISSLKSDIHSVRSDISSLKSDIHSVKFEIHRLALLMEEQNARNKYVLDGYTQIYDLIASRNKNL